MVRKIPQLFRPFGSPPYKTPITFVNPYSVHLDEEVEIGVGCVIDINVVLRGSTVIGQSCTIGPNAVLENVRVCNRAYIGNNAELRRTYVGIGTKIPHNCYLGDASIGDEVNIGAGVITSNFDGVEKHTTIIGARSFIGTCVDIIAPVEIGEECFVAARSRVALKTPIPPHSFVWEEIENGRSKTRFRENCSFKIPGEWGWIWTRRPIPPERMTAFFERLVVPTSIKEWLVWPNENLDGRKPLSLIKEGEAGIDELERALSNE